MKGICWKEGRWGWREYRINERVWGGIGEQLNGMGKQNKWENMGVSKGGGQRFAKIKPMNLLAYCKAHACQA